MFADCKQNTRQSKIAVTNGIPAISGKRQHPKLVRIGNASVLEPLVRWGLPNYSTPGLASHHHHPTQDDKHDSYTITFTSNIFQLFPLPGVNDLDNLLRLAILTSLGIVISCAAPGVLDGGIRTEEQQLRNDVQIPLLHRLMQRKGHEKDLGRRPPWGKSAMANT